MGKNIKVQAQTKAPLNTNTGTRKAGLKPARNSLGRLPDTTAGASPGGGRRPPPGEVLDSVSWILPERVSNRFETRVSGRCLYFAAPVFGASTLCKVNTKDKRRPRLRSARLDEDVDGLDVDLDLDLLREHHELATRGRPLTNWPGEIWGWTI